MTPFLVIIVLVLGAARLVTYMVYGSLIKDEVWAPILEKQISKNQTRLNMFSSDIINIGDLPYISNIQFDILGYYHISGRGVVPRWSKTHKLIKAEFEKAKQKELEKHK